MSADEIVSTLEKVDVFHDLGQRLLRQIAQAGREKTFQPGETVLAEGEEVGGFRAFSSKGVEMHVVLAGSCTARVDGEEHATLGPGDYFGELSLIDGEPRSAEIVSGPDGMTTFALAKWTFNDLLDKHPEIAVPMLRVMARRLRAAEHPRH